MALANWADIWGDIWGDIWAVEGATPIGDGDDVMVITAGGIECMVTHDSATTVRVKITAAKQITVLNASATEIKVVI